MLKKICAKTIHFSFQIHVFSLQNHYFLCSQCIDALKKLNKSCKKNIIFDRKIIIFSVKNQRVHRYLYVNGPKNMCKNHSFFIPNSCFFTAKSSFSSVRQQPLRGWEHSRTLHKYIVFMYMFMSLYRSVIGLLGFWESVTVGWAYRVARSSFG